MVWMDVTEASAVVPAHSQGKVFMKASRVTQVAAVINNRVPSQPPSLSHPSNTPNAPSSSAGSGAASFAPPPSAKQGSPRPPEKPTRPPSEKLLNFDGPDVFGGECVCNYRSYVLLLCLIFHVSLTMHIFR